MTTYGDNNYYSQYPTDDKKYECRTGPFEGFFVSSVEFCKHIKFDDRKDHRRDNSPQVHKVHLVHKAQLVQQEQQVQKVHKVYKEFKVYLVLPEQLEQQEQLDQQELLH